MPFPALSKRKILLALTFVLVLAALAVLGSGRQGIRMATPPALTVPVVAGAGLLDGFNPCSFAGLVLFASFTLAAAQRESEVADLSSRSEGRRKLLGNGLTYISAIFLVYVVLGLGFLAAVTVLSSTHVIGKIAAVVTAGLGLWTLKDVLVPEWGWRLEVPRFLRPRIHSAVHAATPAAIFAGGILVGLCTVPCTGGVYLGVLALLSAQPTYGSGLAYLLLYNVMFVAPLLAVLVLASSRRALGRISRWHVRNRSVVKIALGLAMVSLGLLTLVLLT